MSRQTTESDEVQNLIHLAFFEVKSDQSEAFCKVFDEVYEHLRHESEFLYGLCLGRADRLMDVAAKTTDQSKEGEQENPCLEESEVNQNEEDKDAVDDVDAAHAAHDVDESKPIEEKISLELNECPEDPYQLQRTHNFVGYSIFLTEESMNAIMQKKFSISFLESLLLNGSMSSFGMLTMWKRCNLEYYRRYEEMPCGKYFMYRRHVLRRKTPRSLVVDILCRLAWLALGGDKPQIESPKTDESDDTQAPAVIGHEAISYEILVSTDPDRRHEVVEWASWPCEESYSKYCVLPNVQQVAQTMRSRNFCVNDKPEENFWVAHNFCQSEEFELR